MGSYRKSTLFIICTLSFFLLLAEMTTAQQGRRRQDTTIRIIGSLDPTILDAYKINFNPQVESDEPFELPELSYGINPVQMNTSVGLETIKPARVVGEPLSKLYRNYVKLGYGNYSTPYFDFFINSMRNEDNQFGLRLKHLSSSGHIKDYANSAYSDNHASIFGKHFFDKSTLAGNIYYNRKVVHYYGYQPALFPDSIPLPADDDIKQKYETTGGKFRLFSNISKEEKFGYSMDLESYHFSNIDKTSETSVAFDLGMQKGFELFNDQISMARLDAGIDYFFTKDTIDKRNNGVARLNPSLNMNFGQYQVKAGFTTAFGLDSTGSFDIFPDIEAKVFVVPNYLQAFAGFSGGIEKAGYRYLTDRNPYIQSIVPLKYMKNKLELYGGIWGNIGSGFDFSVRIGNKTVENTPFFITDSLSDLNNKFNVVYDEVNITNARIELGYHYAEKLKLLLTAQFNSYSTDSLEQAWYSPDFILNLEGNYILAERFIIKGFIKNVGKQFAYVRSDNAYETKEIDPWLDISLGFEFRFSKNLSFFADLNNITGNAYQRWYNYPVQQLNFLAGVTYSF